MPDKDNKILKCSSGKNSMKVSFIIYADSSVYLKKMHSCKLSPKNIRQKKNIAICPLVIRCFNVHLMQQKIKLIIIEAKTVWIGFVKC